MSNNGGVYTWSKTPANNATADSTVNYQEGQAPSSLNDSARSAMASVAKYRDDISGSIVTTGTAQNYIVASNQLFDSLTDFNGKMIAFTPHATNTGSPVTMTVDGFANVPVRLAPNTELPIGTIVKGTPYAALFNSADNALYLQGVYGPSPALVPLGGTLIWWDDTLPNSSFTWANAAILPASAVSPVLLARWKAKFGGDGITTMGVPDMREVVPVGVAGMGGTAGRGLTSFPGFNTVATVFGEQSHSLTAAELPEITSNVQVNVSGGISGSTSQCIVSGGTFAFNFGGSGGGAPGNLSVAGSFSGSGSGAAQSNNTQGGAFGAAHNNMQPSVTAAWIVRVL